MLREIIVTVVLFGAVQCRHGGGGGRGGGQGGMELPFPFLQGLNETARSQFAAIVFNNTLTIAQQKSDINTWASTYGVADQVNAFESNVTALKQQVDQNITNLISQLSSGFTSLQTILDNEDQTADAQAQALETFAEENPLVSTVLFVIAFEVMPRPQLGYGGSNGYGGRGGSGGMRGGRGGRG